jgi:hypothetical protein
LPCPHPPRNRRGKKKINRESKSDQTPGDLLMLVPARLSEKRERKKEKTPPQEYKGTLMSNRSRPIAPSPSIVSMNRAKALLKSQS